ncbi:hypothetical protein H1R17_05085 [Flavobacterium sp. xlx-214]|uniref:hypothetical protein n=1 Tax=unclassified Flavobacterium TaxID=196869 RepID=UPI0013D10B17|nr:MULTISPECIES: hypothetical protein [unclassified Flavobacterium]MBA5793576.1 hypothetical protein [Flavobacterium sp. xlx-221]QMI84506.1 hypothetical protein H1R17_05085 [Flavobacterium sp. xlx-214]
MKTKNYFILLFCLINCFTAQSQLRVFYDGSDPSENYFDISDLALKHNEKIKEKLFDGLAERYKVRMLVQPSFDVKYIFQIDEILKDYQLEKYVVRFHKLNSRIHSLEDYNKVKVKKYEASMCEDDILLLTEAFAVVVDKTRYEKNNMDVYDGTNYLLSVWDYYGWRSGNVITPRDAEIKSLVAVVENLIKQTQAKRNIKISDADRNILDQIISKSQKHSTSTDYELVSRMMKVIEDNESEYCSKLTDNNAEYVGSSLNNIKNTATKNLAYNQFNKQELKKLIESVLEEFISFNTFSEEDKRGIIFSESDIKLEKEENIKNNIFQLILNEFD